MQQDETRPKLVTKILLNFGGRRDAKELQQAVLARPQAAQFLCRAYTQLFVERTVRLPSLRAFHRFPSIVFFLAVFTVLTRTNRAGCTLHIFHLLSSGPAASLRVACLFAGAVFFSRILLLKSAFRGFQPGFHRPPCKGISLG